MHLEKIGDFSFGITEAEDLQKIRTFHHDAFLTIGYISNPYPSGMIEDIFVDLSTYYYCMNDVNEEVVGVIRQINGSHLKVPTLCDFEIYPDYASQLSKVMWPRIVEIGSLAVNRNARGVAEGLYRQIWQRSKSALHTHWIASIDNRLLVAFRKSRGFLWEDIGESKVYMGSKTTPVIAYLEQQSANMKRLAPDFFDYINSSSTPSCLFKVR